LAGSICGDVLNLEGIISDYYAVHAGAVQIEDVSPWLSELGEELIAVPDAGADN